MAAQRSPSPSEDLASDAGAATSRNASASDAQPPSAARVLTVGDGNFSYSLALAKRQHGAGGVALSATSYDSYDELVAKYPESARICEQLKELGARVVHRVDATNLRASLQASKAGAPSTAPVFDRVVFNHPHCGEENVRRHQSLLSHFYVSALEVLGANGRVHLTLAEGQPERWEALERARRAGLRLCEQVDDVDAHREYGLEYERKRHQNGRSFHQVTLHGEKKRQTSTLFIFARASEADCGNTKPSAIVSEASTGGQSEAMLVSSEAARKRKADQKPIQKKQKKRSLAATPADLTCHECDKSFKTAQGLKTHVHMVHELQAAGATAPGAAFLPCGYCDRTFKNEDAQRQHRMAKHGKDQLIKPDWYVTAKQLDAQKEELASATVSTVEASPSVEKTRKTCLICRLEYASQEEFDRHWTNLQPTKVKELLCAHCERAFGDERALRQHQNFCAVTATARVDESSSDAVVN